ncbi:DUF6374 family protein [Nocardia vinacea]|uniref:DUF6374 family protein n=1 Tax=Nocardia vinacea TaxID=96468 RepID=UPI002E0FFC94|nr:DUF6374 family protein [Nocardia vinacea]
MPELSRLDRAWMNLDEVREQLLNAAAFGKHLSPDQLEHAARKVSEGMRIYAEETDHR